MHILTRFDLFILILILASVAFVSSFSRLSFVGNTSPSSKLKRIQCKFHIGKSFIVPIVEPCVSQAAQNLIGGSTFSAFKLYAAQVPNMGDPRDSKLDEDKYERLVDGLKHYRECTIRGMDRFKTGDIDGAIADFDRASRYNGTQPLIQRGITLYLVDRFEDALEQLSKDIEIIENARFYPASDLRLWRSACYNRLGRREQAVSSLGVSNPSPLGLVEDSVLMNYTLNFYAGVRSLDDILELIGNGDGRDRSGNSFFGNFYLALYYDSVGEDDLAESFISIPIDGHNKNRYPETDMWYHVPRRLRENLKRKFIAEPIEK